MNSKKKDPEDYKMSELFTASEALSLLESRGIHIARGTLRSAVDKGEIAGIVRGHATFVSKEDLETFKPMGRDEAGRIGAAAKWDKYRQQTVSDLSCSVGEIHRVEVVAAEETSKGYEPIVGLIDKARHLLNRGRGRPRTGEPDPAVIWAALNERYKDLSNFADQKRGRGRPSKETEAILKEYEEIREVIQIRAEKERRPKSSTAGAISMPLTSHE